MTKQLLKLIKIFKDNGAQTIKEIYNKGNYKSKKTLSNHLDILRWRGLIKSVWIIKGISPIRYELTDKGQEYMKEPNNLNKPEPLKFAHVDCERLLKKLEEKMAFLRFEISSAEQHVENSENLILEFKGIAWDVINRAKKAINEAFKAMINAHSIIDNFYLVQNIQNMITEKLIPTKLQLIDKEKSVKYIKSVMRRVEK